MNRPTLNILRAKLGWINTMFSPFGFTQENPGVPDISDNFSNISINTGISWQQINRDQRK